ncbi:MAG: hypothetical protein Q7T35_09050 [Nitrosomonas sp.]|nr:hypothetical protein [Nitrosomonas sp.]
MNTKKNLIIVLIITLLTGCATIITEKADLTKAPSGVRIYPQIVYLAVDTQEKKSTLMYLPDNARAYDIKPLTILAKQDFKIEVEEGQLKSLTSNQDTTAFLTFLKEAAQMAAKAAGAPVSATVINGTFGLASGLYKLGDDGHFSQVAVPH